jgi:hypothetical protein
MGFASGCQRTSFRDRKEGYPDVSKESFDDRRSQQDSNLSPPIKSKQIESKPLSSQNDYKKRMMSKETMALPGRDNISINNANSHTIILSP